MLITYNTHTYTKHQELGVVYRCAVCLLFYHGKCADRVLQAAINISQAWENIPSLDADELPEQFRHVDVVCHVCRHGVTRRSGGT